MKYTFDLQLFAEGREAVAGKRIVYMYRIKSEAPNEDATAIAFTTENSRSKSKDADSVQTKDGPIRVPGGGEIEISATSILAKGDPFIAKLEDAMDNGEVIEIWEANLEDPGTGDNKFKAIYYWGYLTEFELSSSAEDMAEVSLTFGITGNGKRGEATVSDQQQAIADYMFKDTLKTGA